MSVEAVAIGGSAGSLEALFRILPALPPDFSLPIFVVVHLPADKDSALLEVLRNRCRLPVCEAEDKSPIAGGHVYLAPPDYHLLVEPDRHFSLSFDEPHLFSRPSIDVLFESAADAYGAGLVGIVLSGGNVDGAEGLRHIAAEGGMAIVQSPASAYSSIMPLAALENCPSARTLAPEQIASFLLEAA